jgi:hypothetical protein
VCLHKVFLQDVSVKGWLFHVALFVDFEIDSSGIELVVLDFIPVDLAILGWKMDNGEFCVISDLRLLPLLESTEVILEGILLEWLEAGVLRDVDSFVIILHGAELDDLLLCLLLHDVGLSILWELQLAHFLVFELLLLQSGDLVQHLNAVQLGVVNILYAVGGQHIVLVLVLLHNLINLFLSQEFTAIAFWVQNEHSRVDEELHVWILTHADRFDVSFRLEDIIGNSNVPVCVLLPVLILLLFYVIFTVQNVLKWLVEVLAGNVNLVSIV